MHRMLVAGLTLSLGALVIGCGSDDASETASTTGAPTEPAPTVPPATDPPRTDSVVDIPIEAFADIRDEPVSDELAATLQATLNEMSEASDGVGMTATVMSPEGTWSGTVGTADGDRALTAEDQFAIASGTKPMVAAQIMQLVEDGRLDVDDPVSEHLPPDLGFDTNGATIRNLLSHRSGIPDYELQLLDAAETDRTRLWTAEELLALVPAGREPVDELSIYTSTNYVLLGLVIEHIAGRPLSEVLREGVLDVEGAERLVYQPDEAPTEPMAMPFGQTTAALERGGGFLPSLAHASGGRGAWGAASDSPSLARWWRAMCSGEIVSQDSLTLMARPEGDYGLGIFSFPGVDTVALGHPGVEVGYISWSACLPEDGSVVVVLANGSTNELFELAGPLILAARSHATEVTVS